MSSSSPRERGCSLRPDGLGRGEHVVPARAGLFPVIGGEAETLERRPRASGAVPVLLPWGDWGEEVVPARAGLFPRANSRGQWSPSRPRASGAVPNIATMDSSNPESSPRERGCSVVVRAHAFTHRVVPARAGLFRTSRSHGLLWTGRPRASGAVPRSAAMNVSSSSSSPRERGCSPVPVRGSSVVGVVPARAGLFPSPPRTSPASPRRPRASGAVPQLFACSKSRVLSSPRERGCSPRPAQHALVVPVVPARAGLFPALRFLASPRWGRPRASGAVPRPLGLVPRWPVSSPRERGCSGVAAVRAIPDDVVPARAGLFPRSSDGRVVRNGRPRASGAVPAAKVSETNAKTSSPRERGCSPAVRVLEVEGVVVPARAGLFPFP